MSEDGLTVAKTMREIRSVCINQVLGTDMKKHFDIASRFQVGFAVGLPVIVLLCIHGSTSYISSLATACQNQMHHFLLL